MMWLDWLLFGNGQGMASPYFDDVFYYLCDGNASRSGWPQGRLYRWFGGFGAQLHSYEWRTPRPGTRRKLFGHQFVVSGARRKLWRVEVAWALVGGSIKEADDIRKLEANLKNWGSGL